MDAACIFHAREGEVAANGERVNCGEGQKSAVPLTYYARRYIIRVMISSFKDKDTRELYETGENRRFASIARVALRKLDMIAAATKVETLRVPPGNRLEQLAGDREGRWSIRI